MMDATEDVAIINESIEAKSQDETAQVDRNESKQVFSISEIDKNPSNTLI
jgi:hypothetical protein